MNTLCVTEREQKQAAQIRRQYRGPQADKMAQLKKLDGKVKRPGKWAALFLGAAGSLVMGAGMSLVMVWQNMQQGIALGIPGLSGGWVDHRAAQEKVCRTGLAAVWRGVDWQQSGKPVASNRRWNVAGRTIWRGGTK